MQWETEQERRPLLQCDTQQLNIKTLNRIMKKRIILLATLFLAGGVILSSCRKDGVKMKSSGEIKIEKVLNAPTVMSPQNSIEGLTYHNGYLYTNAILTEGPESEMAKIKVSNYSLERISIQNGDLLYNSNNFEYYDDHFWSFNLNSSGAIPKTSVLTVVKHDPVTFESIEIRVDSLNFGGGGQSVLGVSANSNGSKVYITLDDVLGQYNESNGLKSLKDIASNYSPNAICFGPDNKLFEWHTSNNGGIESTFLEYDDYLDEKISRKFNIPDGGYSYSVNALTYAGKNTFYAAVYNYSSETHELIKITLP